MATAVPLGSFGGFGASYLKLSYGGYGGEVSQGGSDEMSRSIAIGIHVFPLLSLGATLKRIDISLGSSVDGDAYATDIGVLLHVDRASWRYGFGLMYQNLGGEVTFPNEDVTSPLNRNYKIGASVEVPMALTHEVTIGSVVVVDYNQSDITSDFHTWNGGLESYLTIRDLWRVAARVGYYYDPLGDIQDFTGGLGLRAWIFAVDGAWIPQARDSDLDAVFKLTVGVHADLSSRGQ